jgi:proline dehydrogenase
MEIHFENTEIAFAHKSDRELRKAWWLFKLVGSPAMVKLGKFSVAFAKALRIPIGWALKRNIFEQFCGGETIDDCAKTTRILDAYKIGTILDYSVEGKSTPKEFEETTAEILHTIETSKGNQHIPFCVFKVSGIARFELLAKVNKQAPLTQLEADEFDLIKDRMERIARRAWENDTPIFVDAEESWIQDTIDNLVHDLMTRYNREKAIVFNTYQMYRHDRLAYLKESIAEAKDAGYFYGVKVVRGAYMEKERDRAEEMGYPSPIQPDKAATDRDFNAAMVVCLDNLQHVAICAGTHNEESSLLLTKLMNERGLERDDQRIYFAQLYGMSDHISFNLSHHGFNVAKYVPYGPVGEVIPYLIRRAEENTSVKGQSGRELMLIERERERRKLVKGQQKTEAQAANG